jgi:beta-lactamase regulating signal transducer with metallopeptidase domain
VQPVVNKPLPRRFTSSAVAVPAPTPAIPLRERLTTALPRIVLIWLVGVGLFAIRNIGGWIALQQLRSFTTFPAGDEVDRCARKLAQRLAINRSVRVLKSTLAKTPMVIGFFKPAILIPASALSSLSIPELESILAHELAHIRRNDYLVNLLQAVAETLVFYHPAVWIISRQLRAERENCCDDLALSVTRDRRIYATALAAVASVRVTSLVPAASGGTLLPRLQRVLQVPDRDTGRSPRWVVGVVITLAVAVGIFAPRLQSIAKAAATQPAGDLIHVRGRVVDPSGKPVGKTKITLIYSKFVDDDRKSFVIGHAVADADGRFQTSFYKAAASSFSLGWGQSGSDGWKDVQVVAHADGFGLDWQKYDHVDAAGDVQLKLVNDVPVHGRLIDLEGNPVAGVKVTVRDALSHILADAAAFKNRPDNVRGIATPLEAIEQSTPIVSDADGNFTLTGLGGERRATLSFFNEKFSADNVFIVTRKGEAVHVSLGSSSRDGNMTYFASPFNVMMSPARTVTGTVTDAETHKPIAGASVTTAYSRVHLHTVTGADGKFQLAGLGREKVEIEVRTPDEPYLPAFFDVENPVGFAPVVSNVELTRGVWITGKVADQQTGQPVLAMVDYLPLAGNRIAEKIPLFHLGYAQPPCNAEVQPDGTFRVIAISGPGVVAARTSLANYALGQGFDKLTSRGPRGAARTLLPGAVDRRSYTAVREIDAAPSAVTENVDFALDGGTAIHVTCLDPDGKPASDIRVLGNSAVLMSGTMTAVTDGHFDVVGMGKNEKRILYATDDKHHWSKLSVISLADAADGKLTLKLEPCGVITGRTLNPQGDPIRGGRIRVDTYIPELKPGNRLEFVSTQSEADGRFTLYVPASTPLTMGASSSPYGGRFKFLPDPITVASGKTRDLGDIALEAKEMMP